MTLSGLRNRTSRRSHAPVGFPILILVAFHGRVRTTRVRAPPIRAPPVLARGHSRRGGSWRHSIIVVGNLAEGDDRGTRGRPWHEVGRRSVLQSRWWPHRAPSPEEGGLAGRPARANVSLALHPAQKQESKKESAADSTRITFDDGQQGISTTRQKLFFFWWNIRMMFLFFL